MLALRKNYVKVIFSTDKDLKRCPITANIRVPFIFLLFEKYRNMPVKYSSNLHFFDKSKARNYNQYIFLL